jgi:hypothetical protein
MRLFLRAARLVLGAVTAAGISATVGACYTAGGGTAPPLDTFYFPTGLTVSSGGNVLYVVNSDFDLQWNGGTLQSYDLFQIRQDAATLIQSNLSGANTPPPNIPFLDPWQPNCPYSPPPPTNDGSGEGLLLGEACAPAVDSTSYVRDSAIIGAFATDLQLAQLPDPSNPNSSLPGTRIYSPVSGNATVTWADLTPDDPDVAPSEPSSVSSYAPFSLDCGSRSSDRCDGAHAAGDNPSEPGNTRGATLPGEPFGLAQSQDGTALVVTSETETQTSLLSSGLGASAVLADSPAMQFILDGVPNGGVGIAAVPHDPLAVTRCEDVGDQQPCVRQAFLQSSRDSAEIDLLRYYDDSGASLGRPFLEKERAWTINSNSPGTDSRGIAIDASDRIACEAQPGLTADEMLACAQLPAHVFIANRSPASLVVGTIGSISNSGDGTYDPDAFQAIGNIPLTAGPSKVYLAPIVVAGTDGKPHYQLALFVVCFDTSTIFAFDPEDAFHLLLTPLISPITTGAGPYALTFDPFSLEDAATGAPVPADPRQPASLALGRYRFAYVGSFTQSYVQMIDLDQTATDGETFGHVVYTLGKPTPPKGQ